MMPPIKLHTMSCQIWKPTRLRVQCHNTWITSERQGCQKDYFQTKSPNLVKFWRASDWKMLIYFTAIWNILRTFGIFYGHLIHFVLIWYIFPHFGTMYQEKSGNPGERTIISIKSLSESFLRIFFHC
jgi:hypothetical protein